MKQPRISWVRFGVAVGALAAILFSACAGSVGNTSGRQGGGNSAGTGTGPATPPVARAAPVIPVSAVRAATRLLPLPRSRP